MLSLLVKNYEITVMEEERFKDETFVERKERVLKAVYGITHTYVVFSRFASLCLFFRFRVDADRDLLWMVAQGVYR